MNYAINIWHFQIDQEQDDWQETVSDTNNQVDILRCIWELTVLDNSIRKQIFEMFPDILKFHIIAMLLLLLLLALRAVAQRLSSKSVGL